MRHHDVRRCAITHRGYCNVGESSILSHGYVDLNET